MLPFRLMLTAYLISIDVWTCGAFDAFKPRRRPADKAKRRA